MTLHYCYYCPKCAIVKVFIAYCIKDKLKSLCPLKSFQAIISCYDILHHFTAQTKQELSEDNEVRRWQLNSSSNYQLVYVKSKVKIF